MAWELSVKSQPKREKEGWLRRQDRKIMRAIKGLISELLGPLGGVVLMILVTAVIAALTYWWALQ